MANPEWGLKRTCQSCGARFYDLKRDPITCPTCEAVFDPTPATRPRRARAAAAAAAAVVVAAEEPAAPTAPVAEAKSEDAEIEEAAIGTEVEDIEADDDEDLIEDASELGEDDDVADVAVEGSVDET